MNKLLLQLLTNKVLTQEAKIKNFEFIIEDMDNRLDKLEEFVKWIQEQ